jgi:invasion protein IalB
MKRVVVVLLVSLFLGAVWSPARADDDTSKTVLWGKQCGKSEAGRQQPCVVQQFVIGEPGKKQLLLVQFGYNGPKNIPRLILSAPLGILLPGGITLTIDAKKPLTVPFETCNAGGCLAVIDMDAPALEQFRKGKVLMVRYLVGDRKPLDLPVKLDGLDAALKSIAP